MQDKKFEKTLCLERMGFLNIDIKKMYIVNVGEEYFAEIIAGLKQQTNVTYFKILKTGELSVRSDY